MRCPVAVKNERRVLCVFPTYTPAFGTFQHAYKLMYGVKAFMPPQGLLLIAAYMPEAGRCGSSTRTSRRRPMPTSPGPTSCWSPACTSRPSRSTTSTRRAQAAGKSVVLGGPSVSASPEMYPDIDYLHVGEMGDATDAMIRLLDDDVSRAREQIASTPRSVCR